MNKSSIEIYRSADGNIELSVKLENDTVWLTQSQMAMLFNKNQSVIARHIKNAIEEGEVDTRRPLWQVRYQARKLPDHPE